LRSLLFQHKEQVEGRRLKLAEVIEERSRDKKQ
jgi:hypothetical protein